MHTVLNDIRLAARRMRIDLGTTIIAIITIAVGVGGLAAVFSVVDAVLLRPLPYESPNDLLSLHEHMEHAQHELRVTVPDAIALQRENTFASSAGVFIGATYEATGIGSPFEARAERITASVIPTLGVSTVLGRTFSQTEDDANAHVVVISYSLWNTRFHKEPGALGKVIELDRTPYTVIGVMPSSFDFPLDPGRLEQHDLWLPMSFTAAEKESEDTDFDYGVVARRLPGLRDAVLSQKINTIVQRTQAAFPSRPGVPVPKITVSFVTLKDEAVQKFRPILHFLLGAVSVVMLIACVNLANLLLLQGAGRRREFAIRQALGAARSRIFTQLLVESALLTSIGGGFGVILAILLVEAAPSFLPEFLAHTASVHLSWTLLLGCIGLVAITSILCGTASGVASLRSDVLTPLRHSGHAFTFGRSHRRSRDVLAVAEVGMALVLLVASGLLLRSFAKELATDPGFQAHHVLTAAVSLPAASYPTQERVDAFLGQAKDLLSSKPGVLQVGLATNMPVVGLNSNRLIAPEGYNKSSNETLTIAGNYLVQGDYFSALQIPLIKGRYFSTADEQSDAPLVVIISKEFADQYFRGKDPTGLHIKVGPTFDSPMPAMTIVGVVGGVKQARLDEPTVTEMYEPLSQAQASLGPFGSVTGVSRNIVIVLRTSMDPVALEGVLDKTVHELDPLLAVTDVQTMESAIAATESSRRFNTFSIMAFAAIALFLALVGIYGVIAYSVTERTNEIAIRMALGATEHRVMRLIMQHTGVMATVGIFFGLVASYGLSRFTQSVLYGTSSTDPASLLGASFAMFACAMCAGWVPSHRAAKIDPMKVLRKE